VSASEDGLSTVNDSSETRSTDLVNSSGNSVITEASLKGNLASRVLANTSTVNVTKDDFLYIGRLDFRNLVESSYKEENKIRLAKFQLLRKSSKQ
jgi:hypothetical protein